MTRYGASSSAEGPPHSGHVEHARVTAYDKWAMTALRLGAFGGSARKY